MDSVLVANKVTDEVRQKNKNCTIVKIDFKKAYDFSHEDFSIT